MFVIKLLLGVVASAIVHVSQAIPLPTPLPARFVQLTGNLLGIQNNVVIAFKINARNGKFLQVQTDNTILPVGQVIKERDKTLGIAGTLPISCQYHVGAVKRTVGQSGLTCTLRAGHSSSGHLKPLILNFGLWLALSSKDSLFSTLALVPDPDDTHGWILTSTRFSNWQKRVLVYVKDPVIT